jgi:hypothetical protein
MPLTRLNLRVFGHSIRRRDLKCLTAVTTLHDEETWVDSECLPLSEWRAAAADATAKTLAASALVV